MSPPEPPSDAVVAAFGGSGGLEPLAGGTGRSWRAGDVVLKPLDRAPAELAWQAATFASVRPDGFRLALPLAADEATFVVDGWTAWRYEPGRHAAGRWPEIVAVGERLHRALAGVVRPDAIIDRRTDPWQTGDRVAWSEAPIEPFLHVGALRRLADLRAPLEGPGQLVHGDLTGNVLFSEELPPAIIDFARTGGPRRSPRRSSSATRCSGKAPTSACSPPSHTSSGSASTSFAR